MCHIASSIPPSDYACALAAAVATLLMTAGQPQELQRTLPGARRISFADESVVIGVGAIAFGTSPTRVFDRPATGCGGGARILDFRGMNPALYCLSYTAENEKARMA